MRVAIQPGMRRQQANATHDSVDAIGVLAARDTEVAQRLGKRATDGEARVQRVERVLEHKLRAGTERNRAWPRRAVMSSLGTAPRRQWAPPGAAAVARSWSCRSPIRRRCQAPRRRARSGLRPAPHVRRAGADGTSCSSPSASITAVMTARSPVAKPPDAARRPLRCASRRSDDRPRPRQAAAVRCGSVLSQTDSDRQSDSRRAGRAGRVACPRSARTRPGSPCMSGKACVRPIV